MSRRPDGSRRYVRSKGGLPPVGFAILSVSQTAGKAAGGTVITVSATGVTGTPTSTLGAVSGVTGSSFQITTNAHAAGGISWTATNGNSQVSSAQTFTYLAAPAVSAISPNNGPQTLTTSGVVITCSNLPTSGSGVTVTATIDGGACTSVVVGATTLTCTVPTDTSSGAKNVVVTIDGVTSTGGTGLWTYNPPPVLLFATEVGTIGGTCNVAGSNFFTGTTISAGGGIGSLTVAYESSTLLHATIPAESAGNYSLTITNPDGQYTTVANALTIVSSLTPSTIFGANLIGWYRADSLAATPVASWPDKSGTQSIALAASGSAQPVWTASDSNFNNMPSVTFDGVANNMVCSAFSTGGTNPMYMFAVINPMNISAQQDYLFYNAGLGTVLYTTSQAAAFYSTAGAEFSQPLVVDTPIQMYGGNDSVGTAYVATRNQAPVTAVATASGIASGDSLTVGASASTGYPANFSTPEFILTNAKPTTTQLSEISLYFQSRYLLNNTTFTSATPVSTTGGVTRISGTAFDNGVTVTANGQGLSNTTLTTVWRNNTTIECTVPPGTYTVGPVDLLIQNPDGSGTQAPTALAISAATTPMSIFGSSVVGWYEANGITLNGAAVSGFVDQSNSGNALTQATGANQPGAYTASDATFNGKPSVTFTAASSQYVTNTSLQLFKSSNVDFWVLTIMSWATATRWYQYDGTQIVGYPSGSAPQTFAFGTTVTFGSSLSLATAYNIVSRMDHATPTVGINVSNGSEVTHSFSGTVPNASTFNLGLGGSSSYLNGKVALCVILNTSPTAPQLAAWETFAQTYGAA